MPLQAGWAWLWLRSLPSQAPPPTFGVAEIPWPRPRIASSGCRLASRSGTGRPCLHDAPGSWRPTCIGPAATQSLARLWEFPNTRSPPGGHAPPGLVANGRDDGSVSHALAVPRCSLRGLYGSRPGALEARIASYLLASAIPVPLADAGDVSVSRTSKLPCSSRPSSLHIGSCVAMLYGGNGMLCA